MEEMAKLLRDGFRFAWKAFKILFVILLVLSIPKLFEPGNHTKKAQTSQLNAKTAHPESFYNFDTVYRGK